MLACVQACCLARLDLVAARLRLVLVSMFREFSATGRLITDGRAVHRLCFPLVEVFARPLHHEVRDLLRDAEAFLGAAPGEIAGGVFEELLAGSVRDLPLGDDASTTHNQAEHLAELLTAADRALDAAKLVIERRLASLERCTDGRVS